ncbi:MAG: hypothetical protein FWE76_05235, partial [Symbiobacteriaceae bacterium]|nr:hypothetical protein [Symbiobacteriaceae bacterium]
MKVSCYADFIKALLEAGFSFSSGNPDGIFTIVPVSWSDHLADSPLHWFSGDPENDPWEWRQRVLLERDDIAYGKFFIRKGSYITREWMPLFLSVRRGDSSLEEAYQEGTISNLAKRIYEIIANEGALPVHELKHIGSFSQVKKTAFEGALAELQTRLFITICGQKQKRSRS